MANQHTTKGQPKRTRLVPVRFTEAEYEVLSMVAAANKCQLSQFIRYALTLEPLGQSQLRSMVNELRTATNKLRKAG